jgi:O-antigen/teichoic acid export membrane protein
MSSISRTFVGTSVSNIVGRGAFLLGSFIASVMIVRLLSPALYGLYALLIVLTSYTVVISDVGLSNGLLRYAARSREGDAGWRTLKIVLPIQVATGFLLVLASYAGKPALEAIYRVDFGPYLLIAIGMALLTVVRNDLQSLGVATGRGVALVAANLAFAVVWVGGLLLLARFGATLLRILLLQMAALAVAVGWLSVRLRGTQPRPRSLSEEQLPTREMTKYSMAFLVRGLVTLIVQKQSEVFFLGHYLSIAAVGLYDVGYSFSFFGLMSIHQAVYPVAIAALTRAAADGGNKLQRGITAYYKLTFIHVVPIAVVGAVFGDYILTLLYGAKMAEAGLVARAFFIVNLIPFLTAGVAVGMLALGRPWAGLHLSVATAATNLGLDALLIPRFGVHGAIAAVAATGLLSTVAFLRFYQTYLGPDMVPWSYLARCGLAALPIFLLAPIRPLVRGPLELLAVLLISALLYLAGIRIFRLLQGEERLLFSNSGVLGAKWVDRLLGTRDKRG